MPSLPNIAVGERRTNTDFVVGDRYGTSSDFAFVQVLERAMRKSGFVVQRNKPYAGGYITESYGDPPTGFHAIQVEINRSLYMDEQAMERNSRFEAIRAEITVFLAALADAALGQIVPRSAAAE